MNIVQCCYHLQAEERSKQRDERKVQKLLRGDDQWMLPSVSKKLEANAELLKKSSKKKKKKKKSRRKSSDSSSSEEVIKQKKRKQRFSSESSSKSADQASEDEWVEKSVPAEKKRTPVEKEKPIEREDWMSGMLIPTFSKKVKEVKKDDRNIASYDPKTNTRELNPFWKGGGDGMPTFQKPKSDSDDDDRGRTNYNRRPDTSHRTSGWRKRTEHQNSSSRRSKSRERTRKRSNSRDSSEKRLDSSDRYGRRSRSKERYRKRSNSRDRSSKRSRSRDRSREKVMRRPRRSKSQTPEHDDNDDRRRKHNSSERNIENIHEKSKSSVKNETTSNRADFLTDQQMNELGAKILKAEILGNEDMAKELKDKLQKAREYRTAHKSEILLREKTAKEDASKEEEVVMLTKTNSKGISKPLSRQTKEIDPWGGRAARKKNKQLETHSKGERVRYFPDDDKYDIKEMVSGQSHLDFNVVLYVIQISFFLIFQHRKLQTRPTFDISFPHFSNNFEF